MHEINDRMYIDRNDKRLYDKLADEWIMKNKNRKDQFLFALAYGVRNDVHYKLEKREEFFWLRDLKQEDNALLCAVAMKAEGTPDILCDQQKIFSIAQEYAHGGIKLLCGDMESTPYGNYSKKMESDLMDIIDDN